MILSLILLALGIGLLVTGGDYLIKGSVATATRMGISPLVVGLTAVAFGTSAPELAVGVLAAFQGRSEISWGNVVGSNIANITLLLGLTALFRVVKIQGSVATREIPMMLLASAATGCLALDSFFGSGENLLTRGDAMVLYLLFAVFLYYTVRDVIVSKNKQDAVLEELKEVQGQVEVLEVKKANIYMFGGMFGLAIGGYLTVESAVDIARTIGVPEVVIGLTLVAIGTSLPELVTSVQAARRGMNDLIIGNIVGSNIFNLLSILATSAFIAPLSLPRSTWSDWLVMMIASMLPIAFCFRGYEGVGRKGGVGLIAFYALYLLIQLGRSQ